MVSVSSFSLIWYCTVIEFWTLFNSVSDCLFWFQKGSEKMATSNKFSQLSCYVAVVLHLSSYFITQPRKWRRLAKVCVTITAQYILLNINLDYITCLLLVWKMWWKSTNITESTDDGVYSALVKIPIRLINCQMYRGRGKRCIWKYSRSRHSKVSWFLIDWGMNHWHY